MDQAVLVSIQVGLPQERVVDGGKNADERTWESGIFKFPVSGPVRLGALNLEGDGQADLQNHGGLFRAVLGYSADHYPTWRADLEMPDLAYGAFGENFTIQGLTDETVYLGDVYAVGETRLQVTQPRMPCWKLAARWRIKDLTARVHERNWGGWYHRVLKEGLVEAGQAVKLVERGSSDFSIAFIAALMKQWIDDRGAMRALAAHPVLTPRWREVFAERAA